VERRRATASCPHPVDELPENVEDTVVST
jgi:hypothetical protein